MLIDWSREFDQMVDRLEEQANAGGTAAATELDLIAAQLVYLQDLDGQPFEETLTLRRVRQSRRYPVWRLSHPFRDRYAIRTIVWFSDTGEAVVVLFANNKARMGDVFYESVGSRADQMIDQWKREREAER